MLVFLAVEAAARPVPEEIPTSGAPISLNGWTYRKKIEIQADGVQQLDLDLETLACAAGDLRDLRVVRDGQQFPYLVERPAESRRYVPIVDATTDPKHPATSLWKIHLPAAGAPVSRLVCRTLAPLFDRQIVLHEQTGEGVEHTTHMLGSGRWLCRPADPSQPLVLVLSSAPVTSELLLEMDNGDNPAIALDDIELDYPVVWLLFRAPMSPDTFLYYGSAQASTSSYDLALIAPQLRAATRREANFGPEERVRAASVMEKLQRPGGRRFVFWLGLGIVVVALLFVIARLLPKSRAL